LEGELGRLVIDDPQTERNLAELFASIEASSPSKAVRPCPAPRAGHEDLAPPPSK
jgi:hypothetical protein